MAAHDAQPDDLMTVRAAAQAAGVPRSRVQGWIAGGRLTTQPGPYGHLVSRAAVQALAVERAVQSAPAADADYVPQSQAARRVGVSATTVGNWRRAGKVSSMPYLYGWLVRLADVQALAAQRRPRQKPGEGADAPAT